MYAKSKPEIGVEYKNATIPERSHGTTLAGLRICPF